MRIYVLPTPEPPTIDRVYVERPESDGLTGGVARRGQGSYRDDSL